MKGSQIGIIGGGIAAAVIIAVLLVSQTGISQDTTPLPADNDVVTPTIEPENEVAVQSEQSVVEAYWDLVFALADLDVKQRSLDLAINLRETTLAKIRVGAMAEVEVLQTEADIALREEALLGAILTDNEIYNRILCILKTQYQSICDFIFFCNLL